MGMQEERPVFALPMTKKKKKKKDNNGRKKESEQWHWLNEGRKKKIIVVTMKRASTQHSGNVVWHISIINSINTVGFISVSTNNFKSMKLL